MAGEILVPHSAIPMSSDVFRSVFVGKGGNSDEEEGLGVAASLALDAIWRLRFRIPPILPSGVAKLDLWALADAVTGAVDVNPKHASVAAGEDPSSATLNAEGTTTVTWAAAEDDVYKKTKIILNADTLVADEMVVMDLTFEAATTLAVVSVWFPWIIWEIP